jgi:nucleotide-binding universal stress UspA family protein
VNTHPLRRPLGHVLVALDLSPATTTVLDRVAHLPVTPGSSIVLLHVLPVGLAEGERPAATEQARRDLAALGSRLAAQRSRGVEIVSSVVVGTPFVEIVRRSHDLRAELVVAGRHGNGGFARALMGSTAERVVRKSRMPVLVVHRHATTPYRRALVATDLSETSREALAMALRVLSDPPAEVRVFHADDGRAWDVTTALLHLVQPFEDAGVTWSVADRRGEPRALILAEAAAWKPDVLALGTHGRAIIAQQLLGHVAEAIVRNADVDVLVARPVGHHAELP